MTTKNADATREASIVCSECGDHKEATIRKIRGRSVVQRGATLCRCGCASLSEELIDKAPAFIRGSWKRSAMVEHEEAASEAFIVAMIRRIRQPSRNIDSVGYLLKSGASRAMRSSRSVNRASRPSAKKQQSQAYREDDRDVIIPLDQIADRSCPDSLPDGLSAADIEAVKTLLVGDHPYPSFAPSTQYRKLAELQERFANAQAS